MERLRVYELAQRFLDERDVGFVEEMMDVLRSTNDDPVEGELE